MKERKEKGRRRRGRYRTRQQRSWIARNSYSSWPSRHLGSTLTPSRSNLRDRCKGLSCKRNRPQKHSDSRSRGGDSRTQRVQQRSLHKRETVVLPETDNAESVQSPCFRRRAATGHHLKERRCRAYQGGSLEQYRGKEQRLKRGGHWRLH
jgi:hypothetical protein